MNAVLEHLMQESHELVEVRAFIFIDLPKSFAAVLLQFSHSRILIGVDADSDSILILDEIPTNVVEVTIGEPLCILKQAIGKRLQWMWRLENHQGYWDGIQFEFVSNSLPDSLVIQLIAAASGLHLRRCDRVQML